MNPKSAIDENKFTNWLERKGAFGVDRAALARDREVDDYRLKKMVNDMEIAFDEAISSGMISSEITAAGQQGKQIEMYLTNLSREELEAVKNRVETRLGVRSDPGKTAFNQMINPPPVPTTPSGDVYSRRRLTQKTGKTQGATAFYDIANQLAPEPGKTT